MSSKEKFILRNGELRWVFVTGNGVPRSDDDDTPVYRASIVYPDIDSAKKYIDILKELWKESGNKGKPTYPGYKMLVDQETGEETGEVSFQAWTFVENKKTGKKKSIPIYDARNRKVNNPESLRIGNGSIGSLAVVAKPYSKKTSKGISLYLQGLQLIKYIPYEPDFGFEEVEDEEAFTEESLDFSSENVESSNDDNEDIIID